MQIQSFPAVQPIKAAIVSTLIGLVLSVLFAVVCYFFPMSPKVVLIVTQSLKCLSLLLGCLLCVTREGGWWKGLVAGALFTALSFLTFSAVGGDFSLSWLILLDLLSGVLVGTLGGIAAVNLRKG